MREENESNAFAPLNVDGRRGKTDASLLEFDVWLLETA